MNVANGDSLYYFRENEVLKHQLRKYVNAVQMLKQGGDDFEGDDLTQHHLVQVFDFNFCFSL